MFRSHRFDRWLLHCDNRLRYVFRSFKQNCRMSYCFGKFLYLKVQQGGSFIIHIVNKATDDLLGVVYDDGRVCQCV